MTISKTRGAGRKMGPVSIGSKIVKFKVHNLDRRFSVHEDLICQTSTYFKSRLQKKRRPMHNNSDPEECCVCQDSLDPVVKDIIFCTTCGQNMHEACIDQWAQSSKKNVAVSNSSAITCPMCRSVWKSDSVQRCMFIDKTLSPDAVQTYLDYLYTGTIAIATDLSRKTDSFNVLLLKCWAVASAVEDASFKKEVVSTFFTQAKARFWGDSVKYVFEEGHASQEIKDFVVDVFLAFMKPGWFRTASQKWPEVFLTEVSERLLVGATKKAFNEVKKEWMDKMDMQMEDDDDVIIVEDLVTRRHLKDDTVTRRCTRAVVEDENALDREGFGLGGTWSFGPRRG